MLYFKNMVFEFSMVKSAGPMIWILIPLGVLSVLIFIERAFFLYRLKIQTFDFMEGIRNALIKGNTLEALTLCEETPGSVAKMLKIGLIFHKDGLSRVYDEMQRFAVAELPYLEQRIGALKVITKLSPLIGFTGTLIVTVKMFFQIESGGNYASFGLFSGQIGEAILSTLLGLTISIWGYLALYFLQSRIGSLVTDLEWSAMKIRSIFQEIENKKVSNRK